MHMFLHCSLKILVKFIFPGSEIKAKAVREEQIEWVRPAKMENYYLQVMTQGEGITRNALERFLK